MVDLSKAIVLRLAKREELLGQMDAIDRAVAVLRGEATCELGPAERETLAVVQPTEVMVQSQAQTCLERRA
jgi:hypothetical protein